MYLCFLIQINLQKAEKMPITQIQSTLQIFYKFLRLLAVADGVGGWNDHGVDPAKYSRELCRHIETLWNEHFLNYLTNPK